MGFHSHRLVLTGMKLACAVTVKVCVCPCVLQKEQSLGKLGGVSFLEYQLAAALGRVGESRMDEWPSMHVRDRVPFPKPFKMHL